MSTAGPRPITAWILAAIVAFVAANVFYFSEMASGSTPLNFTVTAAYIVFWVLFLTFKARDKKILTVSIVASAVSFAGAVLGLTAQLTDSSFGGLAFLAVPLLTPFYGLRIFGGTFTTTYVIMTAANAVWLVASLLVRKKAKRAIINRPRLL